MSSFISVSETPASAFCTIFAVAAAAVFVGCFGLTEAFLRANPASTIAAEQYRMQFIESRFPVAAFGDSHVRSSLEVGDGFDNFGWPSDSLDTIIDKIQWRAAKGGLTGVIMQADPHLFSAYRLQGEGLEWRWLVETEPSMFYLLRPQNRQYLIPLLSAALSNLWPKRTSPEMAATRGIRFGELAREERARQALHRVRMQVPQGEALEGEPGVRYRRLVSELIARGIRVCMVAYPVSKTYRELTVDYPTFADAQRFLRKIAQGSGAALVDLSADIPDDEFANADHILSTDAHKVTELVLKRCDFEAAR